MKIAFFANGDPKGQPRVKASRRGNFVHMYTPKVADEWKRNVALAAKAAIGFPSKPTGGHVYVKIAAYFPRPKSHYRTGKNADTVKATAPQYHYGKPDCDNVAKAILDALTPVGIWNDDAQVNHLVVLKRWANGSAGAAIEIEFEESAHD